ncbi:J domain-containing protein [Thiomicrolovo sp. ZZH C-3]
MQERSWEEEQFIIWNSALGLRDFVMIDRVEGDEGRRVAWLEEPYEMVGPFDFDEFLSTGCINFAACVVMSRHKWNTERTQLLQESMERRRKTQEKVFEDLARRNRHKRRHGSPFRQFNEREMRELLELPVDGELQVTQIKAAYRRRAKESHPDVGGSHELFVQITEARDLLLELIA